MNAISATNCSSTAPNLAPRVRKPAIPPARPTTGLVRALVMVMAVLLLTAGPARAYTDLSLHILHSWQGIVLNWSNGSAQLQTAAELTGPWTAIAGATSPWIGPANGAQAFYRLLWTGATIEPPVGTADAFAVPLGLPLAVAGPGVLANDLSPTGAELRSFIVAGPQHGSLSLDADGGFLYQAFPGYEGADAFLYVASDGLTNSAPTPVTLAVHLLNAAPVAQNDAFASRHSRWLGVLPPGILANDSDADGDVPQAVLLSPPASGSLQLRGDGSFDYWPEAGATGTVTFTYRATDGFAFSAPATVTLLLTNAVPIAQPDAYLLLPGGILQVTAAGVLGNDTDADGDPLEALPVQAPAHGILTLQTNGAFVYLPEPGFTGEDAFTYVATDGLGTSAPVAISLLVTNPPPEGNPDSFAMPSDTVLSVPSPGVLLNDSSPDGSPLQAIPGAAPGAGLFSLNADGSFVYQPPAGFSGTSTFTYFLANAAYTNPSPVSATVVVHSANGAPVTVADTYALRPGERLQTSLTQSVLANDEDAEGDFLSAELLSNPAHGTLTFHADGTFDYLPELEFVGTDFFVYRVFDGAAHSASTVVTLAQLNTPPLAELDTFDGQAGEMLEVPAPGVLGNDGDDDHNALYAERVSGPAYGQLAMHPDGSFEYTPTNGLVGIDEFSYQATDGWATSAVTRVALTISGTAPVAEPDAFSLRPGSSLHRSAPGVLGNDATVNPRPLTPSVVLPPAHAASFNLQPDGGFQYVPQPGFAGTDRFVYRVSDGILSSSPATVSLYVTNTPLIREDFYFYQPGQLLTVNATHGVLANDLDAGDPALAAVPENFSSFALAADGSFTFQIATDTPQTFSFPYQAVLGGVAASQPGVVNFVPGPPVLKGNNLIFYGYRSIKGAQSYLAYVRGSKLKVSGHFDAPTKDGSLKDKTGLVRATLLDAARKPLGLKIPATAAKGVGGKGVADGLRLPPTETDLPLPDNVTLYDPMIFVWEYSLDQGATWTSCGESSVRIYTLWGKPCTSDLFWTVVDYGCRPATEEKGQAVTDPAALIARIWKRFASREAKRMSDGKELKYYGRWGTPSHTTQQLISDNADGQCDSWARFFKATLDAQGFLPANPNADDNVKSEVFIARPQQIGAWFLVKNWGFPANAKDGATFVNFPRRGPADYPDLGFPRIDFKNNQYLWRTEANLVSQILDADGIPGQNSTNPVGGFDNHVIVRVTNRGKTQFYDPSYGFIYADLAAMSRAGLDGWYTASADKIGIVKWNITKGSPPLRNGNALEAVITAQPNTGTNNRVLQPITVEIRDLRFTPFVLQTNNFEISVRFAGCVTDATLSGTTSRDTLKAGKATFNNLVIHTTGTNADYALLFEAALDIPGIKAWRATPAVSAPINVKPPP